MTGALPAVDVVIPTAGKRPLAGLLGALAAGDRQIPLRILVVDDRRRPGSPLLPTLPPALQGRVEVVRGPGRGPAAARNAGWRASDAEWIAFLDDDVVPIEGWPDHLAADLATLPDDVAASQGFVRVPLPGDRRPTDWERNVSRLEGAQWITADMAVRRSALAGVGGFDERFPRPYREDSDLGLRLTGGGWRIVPGRRGVLHPPSPAPWWISARLQAGNLDDALMDALHGRTWMGADRGTTRRRRHVALTVVGLAAVVAGWAGVSVAAAGGALAWLAGTAEFAWARIAPGPRDRREVLAMVATSAVIPTLATGLWLAGLARRRYLLRRTASPAPAAAPSPRTAWRVP